MAILVFTPHASVSDVFITSTFIISFNVMIFFNLMPPKHILCGLSSWEYALHLKPTNLLMFPPTTKLSMWLYLPLFLIINNASGHGAMKKARAAETLGLSFLLFRFVCQEQWSESCSCRPGWFLQEVQREPTPQATLSPQSVCCDPHLARRPHQPLECCPGI